jgi:hypothetical protein
MSDDVLKRLRWWLRRRGVAFVVIGALVLVVAAMGRDHGVIADKGYLAGPVLIAIGAWKALRLPAFLRTPSEIERVDAIVPGSRGKMQVVMQDGTVCRFRPPPDEHHAIKIALEAARLPRAATRVRS